MLPSLPNSFVSGTRFVDVSEQFLPAFMMITPWGLKYLVSTPSSCEVLPVTFLWKVSLRMSPFRSPLHLSTEEYAMLWEPSIHVRESGAYCVLIVIKRNLKIQTSSFTEAVSCWLLCERCMHFCLSLYDFGWKVRVCGFRFVNETNTSFLALKELENPV